MNWLLLKALALIFLVFVPFLSLSQGSWRQEIFEFDSLVIYNKFEEAEKRIQAGLNHDLPELSRKENKIRKLYYQYNKIFLHDEQEKSLIQQLDMLVELENEADEVNEPELSFKIYLLMALTYEKSDNQDLANQYLNQAYALTKTNDLQEFYSYYCVRKSSVLRILNQVDSSEYYALQALHFSKKFGRRKDYFDAHILLRSVAWRKGNLDLSIQYSKELVRMSKDFGNEKGLFNYYNSLSTLFREVDIDVAFKYNDSSFVFYDAIPLSYRFGYDEVRYRNFEKIGNIDSAYFYMKRFYDGFLKFQEEDQNVRAREVNEKYKNEKIQSSLTTRNQWLIALLALSVLIITGLIVLARKNARISRQNEIILSKNLDLETLVNQKQVLLAELQHRVKNNLQQVISILDFQREQKEFHDPEELIRSTKNRVYSMALLHKKLNVYEEVNTVKLSTYLNELSDVVKSTYNRKDKKINLIVNVADISLSVEKAMPLGLITVELISNSMKHAFKEATSGYIEVNLALNDEFIKLSYKDSGPGYNPVNSGDSGIGNEIILGLVDQIDGELGVQRAPTFEISIIFKA